MSEYTTLQYFLATTPEENSAIRCDSLPSLISVTLETRLIISLGRFKLRVVVVLRDCLPSKKYHFPNGNIEHISTVSLSDTL